MRSNIRHNMRNAVLTGLVLICFVLGGTAVFAENGSDAAYASSAIDVDGTSVDIEGYNINGNNYFKLRDIAQALSGTDKQFQVMYYAEEDKVIMTKGEPYEPDGTETYVPEDPETQTIVKTISAVYCEGEQLQLDAYNVNGYNFVKLRDAAQIMDFALMYYDETKSVSFITDKTYAESEEFYPEGPVEGPEKEPVTDPSGLFALQEVNEYSKYFINNVDGYKVMIPSEMTVDMSISEFRTLLESEDMNIEVYRQNMGDAGGFASYVNYGNKFINDSSTYTKVVSRNTSVAGYSAYVLEWYRKPLAKVENDKCYYASVDVDVPGNDVLTFIFKSSKPFVDETGSKTYMNILSTMTSVDKTIQGFNRQTATVENTEWNKETAELYKKYFSPDSEFTWGIFEPMAPFVFSNLYEIEEKVGAEFEFLLYYTNINTNLPKLETVLANAAAEGRTVELTLQTVANPSGKGNMLMYALDGMYDDFLNQYARIVANSEKPVLFRLCNEMNGDWCMYSAYHTSKDTQLYVEFYKYVYEIFRENGALENTVWVWNPNERSFPYYDWNHALCYYPGDEYVDIIGMTGYNNGTYYSGEVWRSFESIYNSFYYQYCAWFSQPMMITEFACSSYGGDKEAWVREMFKKMPQYSRIKAAVWWDGCDFDANGNIARPYFIDDNEGVIQAFKEYFEDNPQ
ncbi:MAG: endoglucanase [Firmicutes bacterium]|nr:endoglucanase [Bacillota bacterium]